MQNTSRAYQLKTVPCTNGLNILVSNQENVIGKAFLWSSAQHKFGTEIRHFMIETAWRRQAIGSALLLEIARELRNQRKDTFWAWIEDGNSVGREFARQWGGRYLNKSYTTVPKSRYVFKTQTIIARYY